MQFSGYSQGDKVREYKVAWDKYKAIGEKNANEIY